MYTEIIIKKNYFFFLMYIGMNGKNINFEDKKMEPLKPQWLKDSARDNLKREIELCNRQHKSNPKDHDICLWLLHN